jgi:hypothetical protein
LNTSPSAQLRFFTLLFWRKAAMFSSGTDDIYRSKAIAYHNLLSVNGDKGQIT